MPNWTEPTRHGVPHGAPTEIPLSVSGDDHPGAVLIALHAPQAVAAYQHLGELADLPKDDLYYLLNSVRKLAAAAVNIEEELIVRLREAEASWAVLGAALDTGRQAAKERYTRIKRAHERGLNTRGMDDETADRDRPAADPGHPNQTILARSDKDGITIGEALDRINADRAAVCDCLCDHGESGICLSCGCLCEPTDPNVCPCCGATDSPN